MMGWIIVIICEVVWWFGPGDPCVSAAYLVLRRWFPSEARTVSRRRRWGW